MATPPRTVMIVDDEPDILEMVDLLLSGEGYRVLQAGGGAAAVKLLQTERPDFIFLDIMMPDMDGHAVCQHIRRQEALRQTPVFMLTAKNDVNHIGRALDTGANGFIVKPFDTEALLRVVAVSLSGGRPEEFYSAGRTLVKRPREAVLPSADSRVAFLTLSEPKADFSVAVSVCDGQHYNLLSVWQREEKDRCITTALLNVATSEHFGALLNRMLVEPGVQVLHCAIYRTVEDIPMHKLESA